MIASRHHFLKVMTDSSARLKVTDGPTKSTNLASMLYSVASNQSSLTIQRLMIQKCNSHNLGYNNIDIATSPPFT